MSETILCSATLAADVYAVDAAGFRATIDATAEAGFAGAAVMALHHELAVAEGMTPPEIVAYHRDRGLSTPVVDALLGWTTSDLDAVTEAVVSTLDIAEGLDARFVNAVTLDPELPSIAEAAAGLARAGDLAADRGLSISIEFLPWTGIADLATVLRLIDAADRPNIGLMLDTWHWFRQPGGPDEATLRLLPPERIHVLQLNDAPAEPTADLMTETMTARLLPGHGDIDIAGLLAVLDDMGADPIVAPEVFSSELAALGPAEMARRVFSSTAAALARR